MVGKRIKMLREQRGVSQRELAEQLGVATSTLSMYELGRRAPDLETVVKLAAWFDVSTDYLLGRTEMSALPGNAFPAGLLVQLPIYGEVSAGLPLLAQQQIIGWETAAADAVRGGEFYWLQVKGDSMTGDGILPGSRVLVRRQGTVENGQIAVVAVGEEEATVKRVHLLESRVLLTPSNPAHPPALHDARDVRILGKVVQSVVKFE